MTDATTFVLLVLLALLAFYFIFTQRKQVTSPKSAIRTTVPGPEPVDKTDGNLADVKKAGSLHEYLMDLHKKYGPLASFWLGEELHISVASAHLFKQMYKLFDRPFSLFKPMVDVAGPTSIQFTNKEEGRNRRAVYDKCFTHQAIKPHYQNTNKYAVELVENWTKMSSNGRGIPLMDSYLTYTLSASAVSFLGDRLMKNNEFMNISKAYDVLWASVLSRLNGHESVISAEEAEQIKSVKQSVEEAIRSALEYRVANPASADKYLLIDALHEVHSSPGPINDDAVTFFLASFHTTTSWLTWTTYYIATHPEVEAKAYEEIQNVLGDEEVDWENCAKLEYLRHVVDESLRCSVVAPYAARELDDDIDLDGHTIPAGTPIIIALGVLMQDKNVWPEPSKFDPERFNATNSKERPNLAFVPFGFAGGRKCPGYRYAYSSIMTCLAHVIRRFKITLVEGQDVKPVYGLATQPAEEVWVTVEERSPANEQ